MHCPEHRENICLTSDAKTEKAVTVLEGSVVLHGLSDELRLQTRRASAATLPFATPARILWTFSGAERGTHPTILVPETGSARECVGRVRAFEKRGWSTALVTRRLPHRISQGVGAT